MKKERFFKNVQFPFLFTSVCCPYHQTQFDISAKLTQVFTENKTQTMAHLNLGQMNESNPLVT